MVLPLYLAQTAAEFTACSHLPEHTAWMACHFSPYGTGLCGLPPDLPEDAMVILNDRIPPAGHDPGYILDQLAQLRCGALLLDLQRPGDPETAALARAIVETETRPVGVTPLYCRELDCPVFLPPVPPDTPPEASLAPWQGREIWLEAALDGLVYRVTGQGSQAAPLLRFPERGFRDESLFCHYRVAAAGEQALISVWRTREDLDALLSAVQAMGVTKAIGLWQELGP